MAYVKMILFLREKPSQGTGTALDKRVNIITI